MAIKKQKNILNKKKKYIKIEGKITIDKLARMTQNGFAELEKKIDTKLNVLEKRFDEKFEKQDKKFEKIDKKLEEFEEKFKDFDKKFDKLLINQDKFIGLLQNKQIEEMSHDVLHKDIGDTFSDHEKRIKKLEITQIRA